MFREQLVDVTPPYRLWTQECGDPAAEALLLVMGANASGMAWPDPFVRRLARRHRVIRYDHRDTGRSTRAYDEHPYTVPDLASDAIAVLDALGVDRAHVVGMSLGGLLVQLLLLDHPDRLRTATVFGTTALPGAPGEDTLPGPTPEVLAVWERMGDERDRAAEERWRLEHWRLLNGRVLPFDADEFATAEARIIDHTGTHENPMAHARADWSGIVRGDELAGVRTPTLVVEAPEDPTAPPPSSQHLRDSIPGATLVTVPGMGHALPSIVLDPLAEAIEKHVEQSQT